MGKAFTLHAEFWVLDSFVTSQCKFLCLYHPTDINNKEAEVPHCAALPCDMVNARTFTILSQIVTLGMSQETFYRRSASHHRDIS